MRSRAQYEEIAGLTVGRVEALTTRGRGAGDSAVDELARLREEMRAADLQMISWQQRMAKWIENWERYGMPPARATL